jgi:hypothetical protein
LKHGTAVNCSLFQGQGWRYGSLWLWIWMAHSTQCKALETKPYCHPTVGQCICTQVNVATCLLCWMLYYLSLWMKASSPPFASHYFWYDSGLRFMSNCNFDCNCPKFEIYYKHGYGL